MTMVDEAPEQTPAAKPHRPPVVWVFAALGVIFFLVGGAGGSYQGKLGDVQKNDNSSFLPGSADSTKVGNEAQKFNRIQSIPGFVVYQRKGGLTSADRQKITADLAKFRDVKGVAVDEIGRPDVKSDVAAVSVPLIGKQNGTSAKGPDLVTH